LILVDTPVWITASNVKTSREAKELDDLLSQYQVVITDFVLAEILQGAADEQDFVKWSTRMGALDLYHAGLREWQRAARLSFDLRRRGMTTALSDLVIASVALEHDLEVYTTDTDFQRIPGLKLYAPV
jgi:predicted nucleic acid-binding protein